MRLTTSETPIIHPDDLNRPRCDMGRGPDRCVAQGSGEWTPSGSPRAYTLCEPHRLELEEQLHRDLESWVPFHPSHVQARTAAMLERMAVGYYG